MLGTLVGGRTWESLTLRCVDIDLEGRRIAVLELAAVREIKAELGSPRDRAQFVLIDETLARRR